MTKKSLGICYGVGVGPGGVDNLTLGAIKIIEKINVMVAMRASDKESRAKKIIAPFITGRDNLHIIDYPLVMAPRRASNLDAYRGLIPLITAQLDGGQDVAVLCEGDPLFYGSFQYVMELLPAQYTRRVVPGVSSPQLASAEARIGLSAGTDNLCFIAATSSEEKIKNLLTTSDRAVIMKLGRSLTKIKNILRALGLEKDSLLCLELGGAAQKIIPLQDYPESTAPYFSLLIVNKKSGQTT
ncbi:MAG: precorrin-2 C(20)-methyltransferase [Hydrotalea sp.]|nr:precorrin-2 C(20)-methyltransferase [Hydrotalea sp.]